VTQRTAPPTLEVPSGRAASTPSPAAGPNNRQIDLKLFWVLKRGQWLLDGAKTRSAAAAPPAAASPDPAPRRAYE
jgi:hypothetical protein